MATHYAFTHAVTHPAPSTEQENHIFLITRNREDYVAVSVIGVGSRLQAAERVAHITECLRREAKNTSRPPGTQS